MAPAHFGGLPLATARRTAGGSHARLDVGVEGEGIRRLIEGVLRRATGEQLASHPAQALGHEMALALRERRAARGHAIDGAGTLRVATLEHTALRRRESRSRIVRRAKDPRTRADV